MKIRKYDDYKKYLKHQAEKVDKDPQRILEQAVKDKRGFVTELSSFQKDLTEGNVLCLGARTGLEVIVFRELGFSHSYGIDINTSIGLEKGLLITGDFHNLPFKDESFANVYTNAFDHCLKARVLIQQIKRILKPGGVFALRCNTTRSNGSYESCMWKMYTEIVEMINEEGLSTIKDELDPCRRSDRIVLFKKGV